MVDVKDQFKKTDFIPIAIKDAKLPIPAMNIGQQNGLNIQIVGIPKSDSAIFFQQFKKDELLYIFYTKFMISIVFPSLLASEGTSTRLRYQSLAKSVIRKKSLLRTPDVPIIVNRDDWATIASKLGQLRVQFELLAQVDLYLCLCKLGQNQLLRRNDGPLIPFLRFGFDTLITEKQISKMVIHVAYCYYLNGRSNTNQSLLTLDDSFLLENAGSTGGKKYPTFGHHSLSGFTLGKFSDGPITLELLHRNLFQKRSIIGKFLRSYHVELPNFQDIIEHTSLTYLQVYFGVTHAVFPRMHKPHVKGTASKAILEGIRMENFGPFERDMNMWLDLLDEMESGEIPLRVEFVIQWVRNPFEIAVTDEEVYGSRFTNFQIIQALLAFVAYTPQANEVQRHPAVSNIIEKHLYVALNFTQKLRNTISALHTSMLCPIAEFMQNYQMSRVPSMVETHVMTVQMAENVLGYLFDGQLAYLRDYNLLKNIYSLSTTKDILLTNVELKHDQCAGFAKSYVVSKPVLEKLPTGYMPWLRNYKSVLSAQRFFILQKLNLVKEMIYPQDIAIVDLYIEAFIVGIQYSKFPIIHDKKAPPHAFLTMANYQREPFSVKPKKSVSTRLVAKYMLCSKFLDPFIKCIQSFFATRPGQIDPTLINKATLKRLIERNTLTVLQHFVESRMIEIFYQLKETSSEECQYMITADSQGKFHAEVRGNAEALFKRSGTYNRFLFSIPSQITNEIISDVFSEAHDSLGVHSEKLRKCFDETPIDTYLLPIIGRIWYSNLETGPSSYTKFVHYVVYAMVKIYLSVPRSKKEPILCMYEPVKRVTQAKLNNYRHNKHLPLNFYTSIGLATPGGIIQYNDASLAYPLWRGYVSHIEEFKPPPDTLTEEMNYGFPRSTNFHFCPYDSLNAIYNSNDKSATPFKLNTFPYFPDIYYFFKAKDGVYDSADTSEIYILKLKESTSFWPEGQRNRFTPQFLPVYLQPRIPEICGKRLFQNVPDKKLARVGRDGAVIVNEVTVYGLPYTVGINDIDSYADVGDDFVNHYVIDRRNLKIINAWRTNTYYRVPLPPLPDDQLIGPEEPEDLQSTTASSDEPEDDDDQETTTDNGSDQPDLVIRDYIEVEEEEEVAGNSLDTLVVTIDDSFREIADVNRFPQDLDYEEVPEIETRDNVALVRRVEPMNIASTSRGRKRKNVHNFQQLLPAKIQKRRECVLNEEAGTSSAVVCDTFTLKFSNNNKKKLTAVEENGATCTRSVSLSPVPKKSSKCFLYGDKYLECESSSLSVSMEIDDITNAHDFCESGDSADESISERNSITIDRSNYRARSNDFFFFEVGEINCFFHSICVAFYGTVSADCIRKIRSFLSTILDYNKVKEGNVPGITIPLLAEILGGTVETIDKKQIDLRHGTADDNEASAFNEDYLLLLAFIIGQPIHLIYHHTSRNRLDIKKFEPAVKRSSNTIQLELDEQHAGGPPFFLSLIQVHFIHINVLY